MFALVCATVFCSKGYFQSKNCMIELRAAVVAQKPLIALLDPDASRGGLSAVEVRQQLAEATTKYTMWGFTSKPSGEDLNDALFANEPIEWNRLGAFQDVTLRLIAERLLPERRCATYVHGELLSHPMPTLPPPRAGRRFHAYCDVHNVGAAALLRPALCALRPATPRGSSGLRPRHLNWTFSGQLIFGQFPRKIVPGMHIPRRKRKTAKGKSVSCAIAHTGLDYSIVNMGSAIFFSPNTHQQQHFATSFNAFRHTSSDAQNITLFFLRVPSCVGVLMPTSFTRM